MIRVSKFSKLLNIRISNTFTSNYPDYSDGFYLNHFDENKIKIFVTGDKLNKVIQVFLNYLV